MIKHMVATTLRSLADRVENNSVGAFTYEWDGGDTLQISETFIPPIPVKFIKVTFLIDEEGEEGEHGQENRLHNGGTEPSS